MEWIGPLVFFLLPFFMPIGRLDSDPVVVFFWLIALVWTVYNLFNACEWAL